MLLNAEQDALLQVAKDMALAARTAPKGRGKDNLVTAILEPAEIERVAAEMERLAAERDLPGFKRDAGNLRQAPVVLLLGSKVSQMGLKYCGLCGFENCEANTRAKAMCAFVPGDLGIAVGSAVAIAADRRADSRIMYSVGMAVLSLKLLSVDVRIVFGIPLSATGKNPFFDRKA
jgi:uncharacterized ferredoxin-like protein